MFSGTRIRNVLCEKEENKEKKEYVKCVKPKHFSSEVKSVHIQRVPGAYTHQKHCVQRTVI